MNSKFYRTLLLPTLNSTQCTLVPPSQKLHALPFFCTEALLVKEKK